MKDCSNHKRDIAGISDMKELANMIGDLHYETLAELLQHLCVKLRDDAMKDGIARRRNLSDELFKASSVVGMAAYAITNAWYISKPFMTDKK